MKIRVKISLIYTVSAGAIILALSLFVYFLSSTYTNKKFRDALEQRANIIAQKYLEEDELSARIYQEILTEHIKSLHGEQEWLINLADVDSSQLAHPLIGRMVKGMGTNDFMHHEHDDILGYGMRYSDNQGEFMVVVAAQDVYGNEYLGELRMILILGSVASILVMLTVSAFFSRQIIKPLREVISHVNEISANKLNLRLSKHNSEDELAELKRTFNRMLDRLESSFEIQSSFLNHASHELKNPITTIVGETEIALMKTRQPEEYAQSLEVVRKNGERLLDIVNSITSLVNTSPPGEGLKPSLIALPDFLKDVVKHVKSLYPLSSVVVEETSPDMPVSIFGNADLLRIAFANLIENAVKFSGGLEAVITVKPSPGYVSVSITDNGIGIPPEDIDRIMDPFFRSSNAIGIKGYGIGLSLVKKIIGLHRGQIHIQSVLGQGTVIDVCLPTALEDPWV